MWDYYVGLAGRKIELKSLSPISLYLLQLAMIVKGKETGLVIKR